jgi:hypothetical protein
MVLFQSHGLQAGQQQFSDNGVDQEAAVLAGGTT